MESKKRKEKSIGKKILKDYRKNILGRQIR